MATTELVRAYENQSAFLRDRVLEYVLALWAASSSFRDADVERLVSRIVPVIRAGQLQLATLTDAYIGQVAKQAGVAWSPGVDRSVTEYRGVDSDTVYRRPAVEIYTALASGEQYGRAVELGAERLRSIASSDLQQARNRQAAASVGRTEFRHFRRVLSGKEDCGLCVIASTQLYNRDDLMPIHPGCDCSVEPVEDSSAFNAQSSVALDDLHFAVAGRLGSSDAGGRDLGLGKATAKGRQVSDYTDLIVSREHGEYGPTLAWRSQQFTSEADIAALA